MECEGAEKKSFLIKLPCSAACYDENHTSSQHSSVAYLTLRLLMSYIYIYGAPSKARNANVVYIWTYVWQR